MGLFPAPVAVSGEEGGREGRRERLSTSASSGTGGMIQKELDFKLVDGGSADKHGEGKGTVMAE